MALLLYILLLVTICHHYVLHPWSYYPLLLHICLTLCACPILIPTCLVHTFLDSSQSDVSARWRSMRDNWSSGWNSQLEFNPAFEYGWAFFPPDFLTSTKILNVNYSNLPPAKTEETVLCGILRTSTSLCLYFSIQCTYHVKLILPFSRVNLWHIVHLEQFCHTGRLRPFQGLFSYLMDGGAL